MWPPECGSCLYQLFHTLTKFVKLEYQDNYINVIKSIPAAQDNELGGFDE